MKYLLVFFIVLLVGCKKPGTDADFSNLEKLTGTRVKTWLNTSVKITIPSQQIKNLDLFAILPACDTDDEMRVYQTKLVENLDGTVKCTDRTTEIKNSTKWLFNVDETSIFVEEFTIALSPTEKYVFKNQELKIQELTLTKLKLESNINIPRNGRQIPATVFSTFIAK